MLYKKQYKFIESNINTIFKIKVNKDIKIEEKKVLNYFYDDFRNNGYTEAPKYLQVITFCIPLRFSKVESIQLQKLRDGFKLEKKDSFYEISILDDINSFKKLIIELNKIEVIKIKEFLRLPTCKTLKERLEYDDIFPYYYHTNNVIKKMYNKTVSIISDISIIIYNKFLNKPKRC